MADSHNIQQSSGNRISSAADTTQQATAHTPNLFERICANCQRPEGDHAHIGDSCPTFTGPRLYDAVKKFTPVAHARRNDPETSKQAAASMTNTEQVRRNIKFILEHWGALTDEEIASYYALGCRPPSTPSGLRTRRKELVASGEVVAAGIGTSAAGRNSTTWRLK